MSENDMAKIARLVADPHADARAEVQGLLVEHERLTLEVIATRARVAKLEAALIDWDRGEYDGQNGTSAFFNRLRAALKDAPQ